MFGRNSKLSLRSSSMVLLFSLSGIGSAKTPFEEYRDHAINHTYNTTAGITDAQFDSNDCILRLQRKFPPGDSFKGRDHVEIDLTTVSRIYRSTNGVEVDASSIRRFRTVSDDQPTDKPDDIVVFWGTPRKIQRIVEDRLETMVDSCKAF